MRMSKFLSRKFVVTLVFALLVAFRDQLGIDASDDSIMALAGVVASYLAMQGLIDTKEKKDA
jgi:hypothetical protein